MWPPGSNGWPRHDRSLRVSERGHTVTLEPLLWGVVYLQRVMKVGVCVPAQTRISCPELRELSAPPILRDLSPGYRLARWDTPSALAPPCRDRLHRTLCELAERTFSADHSSYWRARMEAGFFDQITTLALILGPDGSPVGWGGHHRRRFAGRRALYLDATGILPTHRRFGLSAALMIHFLTREVFTHPLLPTYVVMRTRHPAVYNGWREGFGSGRVFPDELRKTPALVRRIAGEVAEWLGDGPGLDPQTLVVSDAYRMFDGDVYGVPLSSGRPHIDAYFENNVGAKDAVLVVARLSAPVLAAAVAARAARERVRHRPWLGGRPPRAGRSARVALGSSELFQ